MMKLADLSAKEILARCNLPAEALALVAGIDQVTALIDRLIAAKLPMEAAKLFAHALPRREAVWWACMCAAHTQTPNIAETDRLAREAAEQWVRQQREDQRYAAMTQAERAGFQSPEAWAAVAAFWSGPSIAPAEAVAVPPAPHLAGVAVAGAVALAGVRLHPERQNARLAQFLTSARQIAGGGSGRLMPEAT